MKATEKAILAALLALLTLAAAAILFTHDWANSPERLNVNRRSTTHGQEPVNTGALQTAQQLAPLAVTREEQEFAQEALRLADHSVDLAFDAALRDAEENPAPLTTETRELTLRLKQGQTDVAADEDRIAQLTAQVAKAHGSKKDDLQQKLDLAQAQLSLDKNEADDTHQELIRAGGDKRATIQQQFDRHEASSQHAGGATGGTGSGASAQSPEATASASVLAELRAWLSLRTKGNLLRQARQNALDREAALAGLHASLEKRISEERAQQRIIHKKSDVPPQENPSDAQAGPATPGTAISFVKELAGQQKVLSELGQRIEAEQGLAAAYANWLALTTARQHAFLHGLFRSAFWILLIALFVFVASHFIHKFFADITPERRQLHTMRAVIFLAIQVLGVVLILLVIFGVPSNFATIAALAGAGLTVALKDFIVGFFGWFVLMGKDGIRAGDWVEINGVGGEVVEVGLLHTVLLETGNWSDAAHPTGRKVTFVNSFAIEGHYFNFSTSGQWLWDELHVLVPATADPYPIAEAIQKIAAEDTAENARLAEEEWERVTPAYAKRSFTAAPSMTVRPGVQGVNVLVRYITRANERQEVRSRLYRAVVELLRKLNISQPATTEEAPRSLGNRTI
jgi:small-conductance mechanosensitive channel